MTTLGLANQLTQDTLEKFHPDLREQLWTSESSYQDIMNMAFEELKVSLFTKGIDYNRIAEADSVKFVIIHAWKTLELIFRDFFTEENDRFYLLMVEYRNKFEFAIANITYDYDLNESGNVEIDEEDYTSTRVQFRR